MISFQMFLEVAGCRSEPESSRESGSQLGPDTRIGSGAAIAHRQCRLIWLILHQGLGAQQKLTCSASEKCPRRGTRFRNQFEIVRYYPAKKITLIPRRAARAVKGARRAFILTLDSPSRPIESQRERSETKYSEASFRSCPVFSWWNASVTLHGLFVVDFTLGDRAVEGLECGRCGSSGGGDSRALRPWGGCPES